MHFAHSQHAAGNKTTQFALVVVFHVILALALLKNMNARLIARPVADAPVTLVPTIPLPLIQPPVTAPVPRTPAPRIVVPALDLPLPAPAQPVAVTTTITVAETAPPAPAGGTAPTPPDPGTQHAPPAKVRMAALIDGCAKPAYPAQAARNGDAGTVTLALLVGADGRVTDSRIEHSSGFRDLDRAALAALSLCAFKPALHGDVPQAGWAQIAYQWTLD